MKKCPVCSREYRDVVSLCPFDGANLTPGGAEEKYFAPVELPTERFTLPEEIVAVPLDPPDIVTTEEVFDPEATLIRTTHHEAPIPLAENPEGRPNAANEMSLPSRISGEIDPEPAIRPIPRAPVIIPPMAANGRMAAPMREFNPWRIATFALAGLIVAFGLIWAFTNKSTTNSNSDPLAVDPNSINVNTAPPVIGMENGLPPAGMNMNSGNFNMPPPLPTTGAGPMGGPMSPFPSGPPPSLRNMNAGFPPPTINSNVANANTPNFNSGGIVPVGTPKPGTTPKPIILPTPPVTGTPKPLATPGAITPRPTTTTTPAPPVTKPASTPRAAPTPRETVPEP